MTNIMRRSDLERIKQTIEISSGPTSKAAKKAELKKKSEDRLQHWPNTLDALHKKKESFLKEKEMREEAKRAEIDKEVYLELNILTFEC